MMIPSLEPLENRRLMSVVTASTPLPPSGGGFVTLANATPTVAGVDPADGATGVSTLLAIKVDVNLPNVGHGVSDASVKAAGNVTLVRISDGQPVQANANTTGGGDAIILTPISPLTPNTQYRFTVTANVEDTSGANFSQFQSTFTTGAGGAGVDPNIRFEKVALPLSNGYQWTSLAVGPDGRLYAGTRTGQILRFDLNPDGTLGGSKTLQTVRNGNGGNERLITGITFDPASTRTNPVLWVSHGINVLEGAANWSNKISKLTGRNLETYADVVFNLPRSGRDHLTNQMAFGPNGLLYVSQGSQSAQGAPDNQWGLREETMLSAAILQIDTKAITSPLNVKTTDAGGSYNPRRSGAPVRLYATGVRNAYDLLWTRDGKLFAPTNGSAKGGNAPAGNGAPALTNIPTLNDYLYRIDNGGYYGHPNPSRNEFVLNGGNPTSGKDQAQIIQYPVGTQPESNYRGVAFDFGRNESPDGIIEFSSSSKVFGGALDGKIMVAQYSGGDNIIVLSRDSAGNITKGEVGFAGLTQFVDPLDLVQHPGSGYVYVAEYGASRITLLRPDQQKLLSGRRIRSDREILVFNDVKGGSSSPSQTFTIRNRGLRGLTIGSIALVGGDSTMFAVNDAPTQPFDLGPGQFVTIRVRFTAPPTTGNGIKSTTLRIVSNDTAGDATFDVPVRGIATPGLEGENEPSLQRVIDAWRLNIDVGDDDAAEADIPIPPQAPTDEILAQGFTKAGAGNVSIQVIGAFLPNFSPFAAGVGWYNQSNEAQTQVFTVNTDSHQSVAPQITGWDQFDPGAAQFGMYVLWPQRNNRVTFSEDGKNTWDTSAANGRKMRVYPLRKADGSIEPNAYLIGAEAIPTPTDHQDLAFIVRNVVPVTGANRASSAPTGAPIAGASAAVASSQRVFGSVFIGPETTDQLL